MALESRRDLLALLMVGADFELYVDREPWRDLAACRDRPDVDFFPERGRPITAARRVCAGCPVRRDCLDYALSDATVATGVPLQGVWAGTSAKQRRAARREGLTADELLDRLDGERPRRAA